MRLVIGWRSRMESQDIGLAEQIMNYLRANPKSKSPDIASALHANNATIIQTQLLRLTKRNLIKREGTSKKFNYSVNT